VRVSTPCGSPSVSAMPSVRLATPRASRRAMRRTDFCHLTSSYQHPRLVGFSNVSCAFAPARSRDRLFHDSAIRFGGLHVSRLLGRPRWALSSHRGPYDSAPLTPLSPPRDARGARARTHFLEGRLDRRCHARVNEAQLERSEVSSVEQGPLPRNALSSVRLRTAPAAWLGHRASGFRHLFTRASSPGMSVRARLPFTRPVANGYVLFLSLSGACRLLQPVTMRGHTLRATDPRTRVGLSPRCSPAPTDASCVGLRDTLPHRGPASHGPHATCLRTLRSTCVDKANRGPKRRSEGDRAFFERFARALLFDASGTRVTGSTLREVWRTSRFVAPAETHLGNRLAKGDLFGRIRVPSSTTEPLRDRRREPLRARQDRRPVTPPPERHCSGALSRLCYRLGTAPL